MIMLSCLLQEMLDVAEVDDRQVMGLTLDSREIKSGMLFVALQGSLQHGLVFAAQAVKSGACAILWEIDEKIDPPDVAVPHFGVKNLVQCLGKIASLFYPIDFKQLRIIGITGTNGKTSVSHFIAEAMNARTVQNTCAVIGTLGIGIPQQLQKATHTTPDVIHIHQHLQHLQHTTINCVCMEVSSHALDQGRVNGVKFEIAVLTNLTRDHLDYHKTVAAYRKAKEKLFYWQGLKTVVLNQDDAMGKALISALKTSNMQILSYGITDNHNEANNIKGVLATETRFDHHGIWAKVVTPLGEGILTVPVLGRFNLSNLLASLAVLLASGFKLATALRCLQQVNIVPGRMEKVSTTKDNFLVLVDYAHTPDALKQVLTAAKEHTSDYGKLICVFGCGGDRDRGKRPLMAQEAESNADLVIVTDDNPRTEIAADIFEEINQGFITPDKIIFQHNRALAIKTAIKTAQTGDVVVIAGKGHETVQIVGTQQFPFDDRIQARLILLQKNKNQLPYKF